MHRALPLLNVFGSKPQRKSSLPSNDTTSNEPRSSSGNAPQRPNMAASDSRPNARSKAMQTVEGALPLPNVIGGKPKRKPSNGATNNEPRSSSGNTPQRPNMAVSDSRRNARPKTMQTVEGALPLPNVFGGKPKRKPSLPSSGTTSNEPRSSSGNAPQRPNMAVSDSRPNARSKTMQTVEGAHTYGALNTTPKEPETYTLGVSENIGSRRTMEDAYSFIADYAGIQGQGFFAVFDGHAGKHAAEWCGQHFHETLLDELVASPEQAIPSTIARTFLSVDAELTKLSESRTIQSGCTAVMAFLRLEDSEGGQSFALPTAPAIAPLVEESSTSSARSTSSSRSSTPSVYTSGGANKKARSGWPPPVPPLPLPLPPFSGGANRKASPEEPLRHHAFKPEGAFRRVLYTANVGDARAVLSRSGRAVRLSYDHKGSDKKEVRRIQEGGGFVFNNRVNGALTFTRCLGDPMLKEYVVGKPYTSTLDLTDADEFLIIACDGLWDVIEDQPAVELIKDCASAQVAADTLVRHALDNFSHDNITVLVLKFGALARRAVVQTARISA